MTTLRPYLGLLSTVVLLLAGLGRGGSGIPRHSQGSDRRCQPGRAARRDRQCQNQDTNEVATATTNSGGNYTIPFLRPGIYTMTVEMSWVPEAHAQRHAAAGRRDGGNQRQPVGRRAHREGQRHSESPLLETSRADRGTVIDSARIAELPLQSRSPMALAVLVAGVNYNAQAVYLRPFDNGALADWSMNGGANRNNEFLLDGAPNNANQGGNNIAYVPPAEAVQEMKISDQLLRRAVRPYRRRRRQHVAQVGHEQFHGVVYDFMRRKALAANSFLLNSRRVTEDRPVHRSVRGQRRRADLEEQDVLPLHRREVPGRHARAAVQHGADAGVQERRFQQSA